MQNFFIEGDYNNIGYGNPSCMYPYGIKVTGSLNIKNTYDCQNRFHSIVMNFTFNSLNNATRMSQMVSGMYVFSSNGKVTFQKSRGSVYNGSYSINNRMMMISFHGYSEYLDKDAEIQIIITRTRDGYRFEKKVLDMKTNKYINYFTQNLIRQ